MVGADDGAGTGTGRRGLDLVRRLNTLGVVGLFKSDLEVVVSDRADVGDRAGGEDVSGSAGSVLGGTASDVVDLGVGDNVIVATISSQT